jgi:dihydroxyacetone kinase
MSYFVNSASSIVTEALDGLVRASGGQLVRLDGYPDIKVVARVEPRQDRVALISGGGAGHEPAHAGFVGEGMLTAAVSGEIFASPSVEAVFAAIMYVTGDAGCLLIVKNYTGDRLNFGLAAERARAAGRRVEMVIVSDDAALRESAQPRGIAGTVLVHKVAGARAEAGASLDEVAAAAALAASAVVTIGVSASGVDIPHRAPSRTFAEGSGEIGLGIHGEPGRAAIPIESSRAVVERMAEELSSALPSDGPVALMINNLGGLSNLELGVISNDLLTTQLGQRTELLVPAAGLMTSLRMRGFSVSAMPLDAMLSIALLAPVANHLPWPMIRTVGPVVTRPVPAVAEGGAGVVASSHPRVRALLLAAAGALLAERDRLDELDKQVGDGDTGSTFAAAAKRVADHIDELPLAEPAALLSQLAVMVSRSMGASSGVLLSIMLTTAASVVERGSSVGEGLSAGVEAMQRYGGAQVGDRTMLDALVPALDALLGGGDLTAMAAAARSGADSTVALRSAGAGRSVYVQSEHLNVADPGAEAIAVIVAALASAQD